MIDMNAEIRDAALSIDSMGNTAALMRAMNSAKRAASKVIVERARKTTAFRDQTPAERKRKRKSTKYKLTMGLRKSIKTDVRVVTGRRSKRRQRVGGRNIGAMKTTFVLASMPHAWLVEHGHGGKYPDSPRTPAHPFLVPAAKGASRPVMEAFFKQFNKYLALSVRRRGSKGVYRLKPLPKFNDIFPLRLR